MVCFGISLTGSAAMRGGAYRHHIDVMAWGRGRRANLRSGRLRSIGGRSERRRERARCTTVDNTAVAGKDFTAINKVLT